MSGTAVIIAVVTTNQPIVRAFAYAHCDQLVPSFIACATRARSALFPQTFS